MSEAQSAPKKSKKKLVIVLAAVLLLGAGGAGAAWFVLQPGAKKAEAEEEVPAAKARKPLYQNLDLFTVNLQDQRGERFAQIGITLQYDRPETEVLLKDRLPTVRNDILLLLSAKQPDDLLTPEGKQALAQQIRAAVGKSLGHEERKRRASDDEDDDAPRPRSRNPIQAVLFSQFIVQ